MGWVGERKEKGKMLQKNSEIQKTWTVAVTPEQTD